MDIVKKVLLMIVCASIVTASVSAGYIRNLNKNNQYVIVKADKAVTYTRDKTKATGTFMSNYNTVGKGRSRRKIYIFKLGEDYLYRKSDGTIGLRSNAFGWNKIMRRGGGYQYRKSGINIEFDAK